MTTALAALEQCCCVADDLHLGSAAGPLSVLDDYRVTPAPALLDASHQVIRAVDGCEAIVAATGQ